MHGTPEEAIEGLDWWQVIEVAPGVVTPGSWDLRPVVGLMPWPGSLRGLRCLGVGTMGGFWAFELERRGAGEVVAIDLVDPARQDSPPPSAGRRQRRRSGCAGGPSARPPSCWDRAPGTATSACTTSIQATSASSISW